MQLRSGRRVGVAHPPPHAPPPNLPAPPRRSARRAHPPIPAPRNPSAPSSSHPTHGASPDQICAPPAPPHRPRRSRPQQSGLVGVVPDEILEEILTRMPAKSVLRCRAVSRSWRRLTSDPAFLASHHRRQPNLPLLTSFRLAGGGKRNVYFGTVHLRNAELLPVCGFEEILGRRGNFYVEASIDGLVLARPHLGQHYICNLATRQWAPLSSKIDNVVGLFRHQPSGEYRLLYWTERQNEFWVLTVGSNNPRRITSPISEPLPKIIGAPVLLHGNLHVHCKKYGDSESLDRISVFDTVAESFRRLRPSPADRNHVTRLLEMDGALAMSASMQRTMDFRIFVLEDYEHEVWALRYWIKLPVIELMRFGDGASWSAKVVSDDGDVLVRCFGQLFFCDNKGNLVTRF